MLYVFLVVIVLLLLCVASQRPPGTKAIRLGFLYALAGTLVLGVVLLLLPH
jgi:uncharacterized membrane protein YccC